MYSNNHSLGDAVSLFLLSEVFTNKKCKKWARKTIIKRFDLFTDNGESKEESSGYLLFTTQMLVFLRNITDEFNNKIDYLLPKLFYNLKLLSNKNGNIALFGDCDDGLFYVFDTLERNNLKHLAINYFKCSKELNHMFDYPKQNTKMNTSYLIGKENNRVKIVLIGGFEIMHGHNQCLSFLMWVDGEQVVFSPGTFRYNYITREKENIIAGLAGKTPRAIMQEEIWLLIFDV